MATATPEPTPLGLTKSFGFGDRLGLATPGHLAAAGKFNFAGVFAQQSIRELDRSGRSGEDVMEAARQAVTAANWSKPWGADADHLKTREDVARMTKAGYTLFTIDPSEYVNNDADTMDEAALAEEVTAQIREDTYNGESPGALYTGKSFAVGDDDEITFDEEALLRAAVKYGRAIKHCEVMAGHIAEMNRDRMYEVEVSVDETDSPTSAAEHLFFAAELKRRSIVVVSLAPRFVGHLEKGVDYKGDLQAFEDSLERHIAIARTYGPYKLSLHSGSDKFSIYPIFGRICGDLLHVKTAGTSYLEALRVVCRTDVDLFDEIAAYSAERFMEDRATYFVSVTDDWVSALGSDVRRNREHTFLDEDFGRQLLHVTFGSVLTNGVTSKGQTMREALLENLAEHPELYREVLDKLFTKHLKQLSAG